MPLSFLLRFRTWLQTPSTTSWIRLLAGILFLGLLAATWVTSVGRKEAMLTHQNTENPGYLLGRENNREVCFRTRSSNLLHPWQIDTEDFTEKEK